MASPESGLIQTHTHFLKRDDLYNEEKPYTLRFTAPNGFPRANIKLDRRDIIVRDIRADIDQLSLDEHGCSVWTLQSSLSYEDFDDEAKIREVYLAEVADELRSRLCASRVQIFEHTARMTFGLTWRDNADGVQVRKRHAEFPISTGEPYDYNQPTSIAHVDTTIQWCNAMAQQLNPEHDWSIKRRIQCVNVWKPLRGPVKDWPLALCEPTSIQTDHDLEPCDLVYPDYVVENRQVYYSKELRWFYLSEQRDDEAWVFVQTDTERSDWTVAHTAFPMPRNGHAATPRESIEVRALVFY